MPPAGLLNDVIFKIVFGTDQNIDVLKALLNALLRLSGEDRIHELEILNPHSSKEYLLERGVVLDVKSRDGRGRLYNIEVQVARDPDYINRSLYYLARLFAEQLTRGQPYSAVARTVAISLVDFTLFEEQTDLQSTFRFFDREHNRELSSIIEIHYIELTKVKRDKPHSLQTPFEKWLHVLKFAELYADEAQTPEPFFKEEGIDMALRSMRKAYASDEVRELMWARDKAEHDEASRLYHATKTAIEEGRREGKLEGKLEGQLEATREIARKLLARGAAPAEVCELTGLTPDQL